jgi:hypothetical protein
MKDDGFAYMDVTLDFLPIALVALPADYRIVGSHSSIAPDTIRLVVKSKYIDGKGGLLLLLCDDDEGKRTITVKQTAVAAT